MSERKLTPDQVGQRFPKALEALASEYEMEPKDVELLDADGQLHARYDDPNAGPVDMVWRGASWEMGEGVGAAAMGPQAPAAGARAKVERLGRAGSMAEAEIAAFLRLAEDATFWDVHGRIEAGRLAEALRLMKRSLAEALLWEAVQARVREVVRKKEGGGGYVLYSPNRGKKKPPKPVGDFPTKLGAKRAELDRYPPQDPGKLKRLRAEIQRLQKDPKKKADKEKHAAAAAKPQTKKEALAALEASLVEALFREEAPPSEWDDYVSRLSPKAVAADRRLLKLQKDIEKRTAATLKSAFDALAKQLKKKKLAAKAGGVQADEERRKTFLPFTVQAEGSSVGPVYIFIEAGRPHLELSDEAREALSSMEPDRAKALRAELMVAQEDLFPAMEEVRAAMEARDKYLQKLESDADEALSSMGPLQVAIVRDRLLRKHGRRA